MHRIGADRAGVERTAHRLHGSWDARSRHGSHYHANFAGAPAASDHQTVRKNAVPYAPHHRTAPAPCAYRRLLYRFVLALDHHLQRAAGSRRNCALLPRPGRPALRQRVCHLSPALQHEHPAILAPGAAHAPARAQWRDQLHSMQMLIPPAWEQNAALDGEQRAWCEYHAGLTEPWDGPAALIFSDGSVVGGALDRNGLRPARYTLTSHGLL